MTGIYKFTNILTNEAYIGQKESIWLDYKDKLKAKQNFIDICEYKTYKKITV